MLSVMDIQAELKEQIQLRIYRFLEEKQQQANEIGEELAPILYEIRHLLSGGKRFRPYCMFLGMQAASERPLAEVFSQYPLLREQALTLGAALECFHAAALVHDDIIDRSETRRGRSSVHYSFTQMHQERKWRGSASHFGLSAAVLVGDLLQFWADELFSCALTDSEEASILCQRVYPHIHRMRTEVAYGQYFDTLEEQHTHFAEYSVQLERTTRILLYKTAKYTVEAPLLIGASLLGASPTLLEALSEFAIPAGVAFQLRDDLLGVFGDPKITGKPAGDDLITGKRTVLTALTRKSLSDSQRQLFDELLGTDLSAEQVRMLQKTMIESGAQNELERMIQRNMLRAQQKGRHVEISAHATEPLVALATQLAHRNS